MAFQIGVARSSARGYQPPPRPRRRKRPRAVDQEKLERDFWTTFDLDKFASGWERSLKRTQK